MSTAPSSSSRRRPAQPILLKEVRLTNFKSVAAQSIPLRPLSILVGANSSGKSSLLQALLLLVQASQSRSVGDSFPLNGGLIGLGTLEDIRKSTPGAKEPVRIGISLGVPDERLRRPSRYAFTMWNTDSRQRSLQETLPGLSDYADALRNTGEVSMDLSLNGEVPNEPGAAHLSEISFATRQENDKGDVVDTAELTIRCRSSRAAHEPSDLTYLGPHDNPFKGKLVDRRNGETTPISAAVIIGGFPRRLAVKRKRSLVLAQRWVAELLDRPGRPGEAPEALSGENHSELLDILATRAAEDIRQWVDSDEAPRTTRQRVKTLPDARLTLRDVDYLVPKIAKALPYQERVDDLLDSRIAFGARHRSGHALANDVYRASEFLGSYLSDHVRYLGPLRFEPQAVMPMSPNPRAGDIGPKGEFTASVLRLLGQKQVFCPVPGSRNAVMRPLRTAVRDWMAYLGVAEDIEVIDVPQLGHTIKVRPPGLKKSVSLTHVGVGVSQILPVLVLCLIGDPETLILLEQPELHLHPATQQRLGEFLLAIADTQRQLIVETHSEYLVKRLLRSIAEDPTDHTLASIGFISCERDDLTATTTYSRIEPNTYGGFDKWPPGFFDQGPEEARETLRAAMVKHVAEGSS